ncbi:hypothetical protein HKD37_03G007822 [Glycine soja]
MEQNRFGIWLKSWVSPLMEAMKTLLNIATHNVRDLGWCGKWRSIRNMVKEEKLDLLCMQETKQQEVSSNLCKALWGRDDVSWIDYPASNTEGGLLCLWQKECFTLQRSFSSDGFIGLERIWANGDIPIVVNIYALCDLASKKRLWESILFERRRNTMEAWVLLCDFNDIRVLSERKGESSQNYGDLDRKVFNCFIEDMGLEDLPLIGRRFTWTRPIGKSMRRIDHMLVSKEWLDLWERSNLQAFKQKLSDRDFRFLNCLIGDLGLLGF